MRRKEVHLLFTRVSHALHKQVKTDISQTRLMFYPANITQQLCFLGVLKCLVFRTVEWLFLWLP